MPGAWRRYFHQWEEMTLERIDPRLLELVPSLARFVPPAAVIDKHFYSPFIERRGCCSCCAGVKRTPW